MFVLVGKSEETDLALFGRPEGCGARRLFEGLVGAVAVSGGVSHAGAAGWGGRGRGARG